MPYFKCFERFFLSLSLNSLPRSAFSNIHNIAREMEVRKGGGAPGNFGCASTRKTCEGVGRFPSLNSLLRPFLSNASHARYVILMYLLHRRTVLVTLSAMLLPQDVVGTNFFDKRFSVISLKKIATHHRFREIYRKMEILILITPGKSIIRVIPDHTLQYNYVTSSHSVFFLSSQ